ncbi:MAG: hypothetical protein OXU85_04835 [Thaumarchaeota archaeon]|nr:hypothetical protein [Nitrososphaerota archaeon]RNJ71826.1 MAG: hypothetical protein EB833_06165 [Thaumarchaeota archaeon S13]
MRRVMVDGMPKYSINTDTQTTVLCSQDLRGEPTDHMHTKEELSRAVELRGMHCDAASADHSSYALEDGTRITIGIGQVDVSRTTLHDRRGDRICMLGRVPLIHVTPAP